MGSFVNHVRFLKGMHPRVVACSHHAGHWEHGSVGKGETEVSTPTEGMAQGTEKNLEAKEQVWWSKKKGGVGHGVAINDALPINPAPLIGGHNWYDNVCQVERV